EPRPTTSTGTSRNTPVAITSSRTPGSSTVTSHRARDRKSTRLNSSHVKISYAVFCLKKKKEDKTMCGWGQDLAQKYIFAWGAAPSVLTTYTSVSHIPIHLHIPTLYSCLIRRPPPASALFPYTTLFRSWNPDRPPAPGPPGTPRWRSPRRERRDRRR